MPFGNFILVSPRAFMQAMVCVGCGLGLTWKQVSDHQTNWVEIPANLADVFLTDSSESDALLVTASFSFKVGGTLHQAKQSEHFYSRDLAEDRIRIIKEFKSTTTIFYDADNPSHNTFFLDDIQMSWPNYIMLMVILISVLLWSLWLMKVRHEHLD